MGVPLLSPVLPPTPEPNAEEDVANAEDKMAGTEQSEQPPSVADDAVENATNMLLHVGPRIRGGAIAFW